ncbi:glycosyltransferase [Halomicronema sp. CCY15110]|uniref:glycosyltransferase family protein n=1 Tax=Halomicronema sp. CCY15110 TaxID=2767773 RepID=UPI00194EF4C2|nr:glycosyltransferase [Halomicronema sp. CCY15110]
MNNLMFTVRDFATLVGYSYLYEFEDACADVLDAKLVKLSHYDELNRYRRLYKYASRVMKLGGRTGSLADSLVKSSLRQPLNESYDFFFATLNNVFELFTLMVLGDWRKKCDKAACYITEVRVNDFPECEYLLDFLRDFDHIFLGTRQCVDEVASLTGRPCSYLPISADTLRFRPFNLQSRPAIDCANLGRRSAITHQALMDYTQSQNLFYYYDTASISNVVNAKQQQTFVVKDPAEHRMLLANILKNSCYFIANRSRANETEVAYSEISSRFFEGAAAGTVMLGIAPDTEEFHQNFDWQDAIIPIPFDCPNIADIIQSLNSQPERLEIIRRQNVSQAMLRHDSVHRLQKVFETLNLAPTPKMLQRVDTLKEIAHSIYQPQAEQV